MKPIFNLTPEELEIENALECGEEISVPVTEEERGRFAAIARNTLAKNKTVTIRISERNLTRLKAAAAREGLSYQTFVTSLIQKHV